LNSGSPHAQNAAPEKKPGIILHVKNRDTGFEALGTPSPIENRNFLHAKNRDTGFDAPGTPSPIENRNFLHVKNRDTGFDGF